MRSPFTKKFPNKSEQPSVGDQQGSNINTGENIPQENSNSNNEGENFNNENNEQKNININSSDNNVNANNNIAIGEEKGGKKVYTFYEK